MKQSSKLITIVTIGITVLSIFSIYLVSVFGISPFQRINFESKIMSHKFGGERSEYITISVRPDLKFDRKQIEQNFQISPSVSFDIVSERSGITLFFTQPLISSTEYKLSLGNGLYPQFSYTFKTPPIQIVSINNAGKSDSSIKRQDFSGNSKIILKKPFLIKAGMTTDKIVYTYKNSSQTGESTYIGFIDYKSGISYHFPQEYGVLVEIYIDEISNQIIVQDATRPYEILDLNSKSSYKLFDDSNDDKTYFLQEYLDKNTVVLNSNLGNTYLYDLISKTKTFIGKFGRVLNYNSTKKQLCFSRDDAQKPISLYTIGLDFVDIEPTQEKGLILGANSSCDGFFVVGGTYENPDRFLAKDNQKVSIPLATKKDSLSTYSIVSSRGYIGISQIEYSIPTQEYEPALYIFDVNTVSNFIKLSNSSNLILF